MKIALVCSSGGHLTEMLLLMEAFENHEIFFVTYDHPTTKQLGYKKFLIENIGTNPWKMIKASLKFLKILRREKPTLIISTGAEISVPCFILARIMGIKTIYIESWCRVVHKSFSGKILYYFTNTFLVQWPQLLERYGKKARYEGAVI